MLYNAYLLDIEGTTTPADFVYQKLFPLARRALPEFVHNSLLDPGAAAALYGDARLLVEEYEAELASGSTPPPWEDRPAPAGVLHYLEWLMEHDRKSRGLKSIQGRIWESAYRSGALFGQLYPDVEPAIRRWRAHGARVYIFSSGSVLAQKLLFAHLPNGDLTPLLDGHFDTEVGSKRAAASYTEIAERIGLPPSEILFLSDTREEIDAAQQAHLAALLVRRDSASDPSGQAVHTFSDLP